MASSNKKSMMGKRLQQPIRATQPFQVILLSYNGDLLELQGIFNNHLTVFVTVLLFQVLNRVKAVRGKKKSMQ